MQHVRAHIIYGNPQTQLWENVAALDLAPYETPDFSLGAEAVMSALKIQWTAANLPSDETIEIHGVYSLSSENFALHVRQNSEAVAQVLCKGMPSLIFKTLGGATVNIQIHKRGMNPSEGNA